jgi:hypothetical protein
LTNLAKLQRSKGETSKNIGLCGLSFGRAAQTFKAGLVSSPNRKIVVQSNGAMWSTEAHLLDANLATHFNGSIR